MYNVGFNYNFQLHAAQDQVVLYTNPRGSTGYGYDFANAIQNAYPGNDYDDIMAGVDEIISRGYIDENKMYVYGGSGGGVLTSWIVGKTDRFAAASVDPGFLLLGQPMELVGIIILKNSRGKIRLNILKDHHLCTLGM